MMAMEGSTITSRIKNLLRSPSIKLRRSKAGNRREDLSSKVSPSIGRHPFLALPSSSSVFFGLLFFGKEENQKLLLALQDQVCPFLPLKEGVV